MATYFCTSTMMVFTGVTTLRAWSQLASPADKLVLCAGIKQTLMFATLPRVKGWQVTHIPTKFSKRISDVRAENQSLDHVDARALVPKVKKIRVTVHHPDPLPARLDHTKKTTVGFRNITRRHTRYGYGHAHTFVRCAADCRRPAGPLYLHEHSAPLLPLWPPPAR